MPTLEKWLLATVIALLVGLWHAADTALRERATRKSLSPPARRHRRGRRAARPCRRWPRRVQPASPAPPDAGESPPGTHTRNC